MLIGIIAVFLVLLVYLFQILLKQSKRPTGIIGTCMMYLWNSIYLPLVKWAMSNITVNDGITILDIGVGNGASSDYLLQQTNLSAVTGIDISDDAMAQAKKKYLNQRIDFKIMDVHDLIFDSETFDLVTAFQTHFHWDDLGLALREIHRVLKPNGIVVFACETAKINYFLAQLKNSADFQVYTSEIGFIFIDQHVTSQWTMYTFRK
ncbi:class I SAM-dependent methyltransferase [Enterococcus ureasiticus]|uniref:16S rRNA (Cytosine(1402)-N(4))-methyltransferase n=1 Tax=Enterococcus ureasiticus TaxID=903984 RepID=A0A1E5GDG6_9ENTE|nr:class I SAM-dependent methyltransferase [Enterococcus ureasiticus]OEG10758.1 16S rRNA (cytosine(1402)-N(4))-methyltransferase [Enterococcus ureasiticus]